MDIFFLAGIFLLPFENFFFAPSNGWATVTPVIFVLYILANWRYMGKCIAKYKRLLLIVSVGIVITLFNFFFINDYVGKALVRTLSSLISLGLGLVSLFSFHIYFIEKKHGLKKVERLLILSYGTVVMVGVIQFAAVLFDITMIKSLASVLSKRDYLYVNRVQFTFTEPSFIGMHLFGVLLPVYMYGKNKKLRNLIIIFSAEALLFLSSVRFMLDVIVVLLVLMLYRMDYRKAKKYVLIIVMVALISGGASYAYHNVGRVRNIMAIGLYADGSLASRWFRINATIKGYKMNFLHAMLGYGLGQEVYPLKQGYDDAENEYLSTYRAEVNALYYAEQTAEESVSYSLYTRVFSEFGGIIFIVIFGNLIFMYCNLDDKKIRALFVIIAYLYIQFESYAFYSIWLLMVLNELGNRKSEGG